MTTAVQWLAIALAVPYFAACGTTIAQTAKPGPTIADDGGASVRDDAASEGAAPDDGSMSPEASSFQCMLSTQPTPLPSDPLWGGGDIPQSSPLLGTYRSGEGPGVYVVSSGSFRLYVNGLLLAASTTPGQPTFVPLTLLPGDNVVAVVAAGGAAPLALIHVDELEKPHVSTASDWKVSVDPTGDWRAVDYDDRTWTPATDFGAFRTQPGCDPVGDFPSDSTAHWIGAPGAGASAIALRARLRIEAVGFGAGTTGGGNSAPTLVSSAQELETALAGDTPAVVLVPQGLMDLRPTGTDVRQQMTCPMPCGNDPTKTAYTVVVGTFTCADAAVTLPRNDRRIVVGSQKTLVGLGRGALLRGASLLVGASQNVILRNLAIYDVNPSMIEAGDGVTIAGADHIWIDHVTYRWISDGFDDVSAGSTNITASWIHYDGRNELECSGRHVRSAEVTSSTMTFHHDWWDNSEGRAPAVDGAMAQVHLFDNLWNDNPSYAVGSFCAAQVMVEEAYVENVATPTLKGDAPSCPGVFGSIDAREGTNFYGAGVGAHRQNDVDTGEPHDAVFTLPYAANFVADPALDVRALVRSRAGAGSRWSLPFDRN